MSLFKANELRSLEKKYADGIGSAAIVELFQQKGERFSEATLRKYVQLGLLPKSQRVGTRGRHRGSSGRYPAGIVRQINDIKSALDKGATLEEIRLSSVGLSGEVDSLRRVVEATVSRFDEAVKMQDKGSRVAAKRSVDSARKALVAQVKALHKLAANMKLG